MDFFKASLIAIFLAELTLCTVAQDSDDIELVSTIDSYRGACAGEEVVYRCTAWNSRLIMWRSELFIPRGSIQFSADLHNNGYGEREDLPLGRFTFAQLLQKDNNTMISELRVTVPNDVDQISVTCTKEESPRSQDTLNHQVIVDIDRPIITTPDQLYYNPDDKVFYYNISWEHTHSNDIDHYEVLVDGSERANTNDVFAVFMLSSNHTVTDSVSVTVTVVDRCKHTISADVQLSPMLPQVPTTSMLVPYIHLVIDLLVSLAVLIFLGIRMWLFVIAEKIRDPEGKSSETLLKVIMVTLSVVVLLSFLVNIAILSTYGALKHENIIFFGADILTAFMVSIECIAMMVLSCILNSRLSPEK